MRSALALLPLLFLFLFASVESRQAPRIQNLPWLKSDIQSVNDAKTQARLVEGVKHKCKESPVTNTKMTIEKEVITEDFEPRPSLTSYNDGVIGATLNKKFVKNFEFGHKGEKPMVNDEFEPRPSASKYND